MNPRFVEILCCPRTGSDLKLTNAVHYDNGTIKSGILMGSTRSYPVIDGIPRFVEQEEYSSSFGYEWKKWSRVQFESENIGKKMAGHTRKMFETVTGFTDEDLKGKLVVEFGCGPGRFLDIVRSKMGIAVGIDMSLAVESARENFKDDVDVLIVQGDILNPPFKKDVFDLGYSIGVFHHTPDPESGFNKLVDVVKKGGLVACCVYPKKGFYDYPSVAFARRIHNSCKAMFGNRLALGYAYFSAYLLYYIFALLRMVPLMGKGVAYLLEKYIFVTLPIPDARWRILDIFDAITPYYASTHTAYEVSGWFEKARCRDIRRTSWCETSFVGIKGDQ